jgi:hypothetical protein
VWRTLRWDLEWIFDHFWPLFRSRFLVPFLSSIFPLFLVNSQSRICLFYGTFSISRVVPDPFLDPFWTVHLPAFSPALEPYYSACRVSHPRSILYPSGVADARLPAFEKPQSAQTRKMGSGRDLFGGCLTSLGPVFGSRLNTLRLPRLICR